MKLIFVTTLKPMTDKINDFVIEQTNAVKSWLKLNIEKKIIVCGVDEGVKEFCQKYNIIHEPNIKYRGAPIVSEMMKIAYKNSEQDDIIIWINGDIILTNEFTKVIKSFINDYTNYKNISYCLTCSRYNWKNFSLIDFDDNWESYLNNIQFELDDPWCLDLFVHNRGGFDCMPEFAIGRTGHDTWMLNYSKTNFEINIDITNACKIIHQLGKCYDQKLGPVDRSFNFNNKNHDYNINRQLLGSFTYSSSTDFSIKAIKSDNGEIKFLDEKSRINKIYICHYEKYIDRKKYIQNFFNIHGINNYEFRTNDREFIDEKTKLFDYKPLQQDLYYSSFNHICKKEDEKMNTAYIANTITHIEIYQEISKSAYNDKDLFLILEDDSIFENNFFIKLNNYLINYPEDLDIGYLVDGCGLHHEDYEVDNNKIWYEKKDKRSRTTCAYIITKKCCEKIINNYNGFSQAIDWHLIYISHMLNLKIYWCEPTLIKEGSYIGVYKSTVNINNTSNNDIVKINSIKIPYINSNILISRSSYDLNNVTWNYNGDIFDKKLLEFFSQEIDKKPNAKIIDIGAQSGLFSLLSNIHKNTTWFSYEPDIINYNLLQENIKLNNIKNCNIFNIGISDENTETTLYRSNHFGLHTIGNNNNFDHKNSINIVTKTLDELFPNENIDFIKIDTEGAELKILKGGVKLIKRCKPKILLEYNKNNLNQCNTSIEELTEFIYNKLHYKIDLKFDEDIYISSIYPIKTHITYSVHGFGSNITTLIDWLYNVQFSDNMIVRPKWIINNINIFDKFFINKFEDNIKENSMYETWGSISYIHANHPDIIKCNINPITDILTNYNGYFWMTPNVYKHCEFQELRQRYNTIINKYLEPTKIITDKINKFYTDNMKDKKIIGIHLRNPVHYKNINNMDIKEYISNVVNSISNSISNHKNYDIFIASDLEPFISAIKHNFKDRNIIYYPQKRIDKNLDWNSKGNNIIEEIENALIDILLLSKCNYLLGSSSNMFFITLCFNPYLQFSLIPFLENLDSE